MEFYDEELLEKKRELERKKHTTLETGIYAGDKLIEFTDVTLPDTKIHLPLPKRFTIMPDVIKNVKYPSTNAPQFIMSSLDVTVNFAFNYINVKNGDVKAMSNQFQTALKNLNPSHVIKQQADTTTSQGNEMSWFEYNGYQLDGQSHNRVCLVKMKDFILHAIFNCPVQDRDKWGMIVEQVFLAVKEEI